MFVREITISYGVVVLNFWSLLGSPPFSRGFLLVSMLFGSVDTGRPLTFHVIGLGALIDVTLRSEKAIALLIFDMRRDPLRD